MHVLIIEDDIPLATQIGDTIEAAGDEPDYADDEGLALRLCKMNRYDIVVLDSAMPGCGVDAFCQRLVEAAGRRTPVLALAAGSLQPCEPETCGPHAFALRTTEPRELHQQLKTLLTEYGRGLSQLTAGELHMDLEAHSVYCGQVPVELAPISFRILELLVRACPGVVTRAQIEKQIWNDNPPESDAALRGHIHRLRQLLERPTARQMIRTVHGVGYQLDAAH
ncbi:response regulator transcription factor [Salinisphaera hydrothermalis]|uniref:Transcriptional regulator n=1 Tax=Salinisphaera hydrothermalis (strain C41B8) TaxID=1304275 RepID=A0A084IQN1_SALHC|nr:response regulator transcription factor [Salinisphaera hydrothermalis]KEZ79015.1 transcriptional regulator [Salinisphaera hydrothermalis C41B8]